MPIENKKFCKNGDNITLFKEISISIKVNSAQIINTLIINSIELITEIQIKKNYQQSEVTAESTRRLTLLIILTYPFVRPRTVPLQSPPFPMRVFSVNDKDKLNGRTETERYVDDKMGKLK